MTAFIGIDLGTTYSAVATIDETGRPVIVHNLEGHNITPSCVTIADGKPSVGEHARSTWHSWPEEAAARFKRDMGTAQTHAMNGKEYSPTDLSAIVLRELARGAAEQIGPIGEAVVTIPANFSHEARDATMAAAKAAGLNVKYIINEPTAAALYYAFSSDMELKGEYAVYDLGGGTFDISIIRIVGKDVEVIATNGVAKLGGDDFDLALRQIAQEAYEEANGEALEPREFTTGMAENEKKSLSRRSETRCRVLKMNLTLSRDEFLEAISPLVTQAEMLCEATVAEAGIDKSDIQGVFLVGGSTRIPYVRESVARVFGQEPTSTANVDEVVALGAALYAAYKGDHSNLSAVQKQSIQKIKVQETTAKCFGTISLASNSARDNPELQNTILIAKGEHIPCSVTEKFQTSADNQTRVALKVTESVARETDPRFVKTIWEGELELPSGRPAGQGIDITFAYDDNQVMRCSFVDVETAREINVDLSPARSNESSSAGVDQFLVE